MQILINEENPEKVIIEVDGSSIESYISLLTAIATNLRLRLESKEFKDVPAKEEEFFDDTYAFISNLEDALNDMDNEIANLPDEIALDWFSRSKTRKP